MIPIAQPELGEEERERVAEVLASGQLADGPVVRDFEAAFAEYCEADHGVAASNGTTALHMALHALDIGDGDTVVTTPFTFIATANMAVFCGADVEFVDIDPETYNIDPDALEARLRDGDDVDAVIAVHLYGLPAPMTRLAELAEEYDFALVEDAAQAHGATVDGRPVGSLGDAATFSFYPTKNMTTGEGGMVTTDRSEVAARARRFADHGRTGAYEHAEPGHNFRLTSIAAAIGLAQLERLPEYTERRRENAAHLSAALADADVVTPNEPEGTTHVYHQYTVRATDRDGLQAHLEDEGVGTGIYYPKPLHMQPPYEHVDADAPEAERAAREVISLPVHPNVSERELDRIADAVYAYEGGGA